MTLSTTTFSPVPWYRRAGVWLGIGINPGSITIGGTLAADIPLRYLLFLIPIGALALLALTVTQGMISRHRREPLAKRAETTFGLGLGLPPAQFVDGLWYGRLGEFLRGCGWV